jgi:hypothetical protein
MSLLVVFLVCFFVYNTNLPLVASRGSAPNWGTGSRSWPSGAPPGWHARAPSHRAPGCIPPSQKTGPGGGLGGPPGGARGGAPGGPFVGVRAGRGRKHAKGGVTPQRARPPPPRPAGPPRWGGQPPALPGRWGGPPPGAPPGGTPPGGAPGPPQRPPGPHSDPPRGPPRGPPRTPPGPCFWYVGIEPGAR